MNNIWRVCGAVVCMTTWVTAHAQQVENRTIAVVAEGRASSLADTATVHVGFTVYGPTGDDAFAHGADVSTAIIGALRKAGVPQDSIESESQSVSHAAGDTYDRLPTAQKQAQAFRMQQSWTMHVPAAAASRMLGIAIQAGANESGQIDWNMKDPDALHAEAMKDATHRAHAAAEAIAHGMGVTLGPLLTATNRSPAVLPGEVQENDFFGGSGGGLAGGMLSGVAYKQWLTVTPRKIDNTATVSAVYAIQ